MKSKGLKALKSRLEKEIKRNEGLIRECQESGERLNLVPVAKGYIEYHKEIIKLIEEVDKSPDW